MSNKFSTKVKHQCQKCEHIELYTKKEVFKNIVIRNIYSIIFILGLLMLFILILVGPTFLAQTIAPAVYLRSANIDDAELREFGANLTIICHERGYNTDSMCHTLALFEGVKDVRYLPANKYDSIPDWQSIYEYGADCKGVSTLFAATMQSMGFDARIDCSLEESHCVAVVPHTNYFEKGNDYMVVDLTIPAVYILQNNVSVWDYRKVGYKYQGNLLEIV